MDAVAKAADVTRLTVYNQFQSRRGLLEAVFERIASEGGLGRIPEAMARTNPVAALERLIEIFCDFWSHDEAIGRLSEAAASDPEFAQAISERVERLVEPDVGFGMHGEHRSKTVRQSLKHCFRRRHPPLCTPDVRRAGPVKPAL